MKVIVMMCLSGLLLSACTNKEPSLAVTQAEYDFLHSVREAGLSPEKCAFGGSNIGAGGKVFAKARARASALGNFSFPELCVKTVNGVRKTTGQVEGARSILQGSIDVQGNQRIIMLQCFEKIVCK